MDRDGEMWRWAAGRMRKEGQRKVEGWRNANQKTERMEGGEMHGPKVGGPSGSVRWWGATEMYADTAEGE